MQGNELAYIRQKLIAIGPTFEIYRNGRLVAVVKKKLFSFLRHVFTVDVPGPVDLVAAGDFWDHEYTFSRDGRVVGQVSKRWIALSDTYGVEIADGEDAVLVLTSPTTPNTHFGVSKMTVSGSFKILRASNQG